MKNNISSYKDLSEHKALLFLSMLYVVITTVPTLFLYRLIQIGPLLVPGGMFIFPFIYVLGDIIAEVYGYKIARMIIWYSLVCNFIFGFAILSVIYLPYPANDKAIADIDVFVFHAILRGDIANVIGIICGSFFNAYLLTKWKVLVKGRLFIIRSFTSSAIGEFIMLVLWVTIAFGGKLHEHSFMHLAISDYVVRLAYAAIFALPAALIVKLLKKHEQIDIYDFSTNFNPFKLELKE